MNSIHTASTSRGSGLFRLLLAVACAWGAARPALAQPGPTEPITITSEHRARIIDSLCGALDSIYVFPDVADQMSRRVRTRMKDGAYDSLVTLQRFTSALTHDFQDISHDRHLRVGPGEERDEPREDAEDQAQQQAAYLRMLEEDNFGFRKLEMLPGNIGYVRFDGFVPAEFGGATAIAAMNFLAHSDAIIFDLRQNGGGSPSMIQLLTSYLLEEPTHLNSFYIRREDTTRQFWTQAYVEGPKLTDAAVYVLTSSRTFSAAEEFTYNLKNLERATIVGETTGGGAHPVEGHWFRIDDGVFVEASIPFGRAINPITGINWEGTGVEPHVAVPTDQALEAAQLHFLTGRLEGAGENQRFALEWAIQGLEARMTPVALPPETLGDFVGTYGPRVITLEDGELYYQREDRPRYALRPLGDDTFELIGLDYFRVRFERAPSGDVIRIIGMYNTGQMDLHERTPDVLGNTGG